MARASGFVPLVVLLLVSTAFAGCLDTFSGNSAPTAEFSMNPNSNFRTGDSITFNAGASSDSDGDSLSFSWTFGDGNTGTGATTTHSYVQNGEYSVKLIVSDGTIETTKKKTITVADASAAEPQAEITSTKDNDCDGEEAPAGSFIMVWVCENDKDLNERTVEVSTTVTLDASDSWAEEYISEWNWDLDMYFDSDGDGDTENDIDATGETFDWTDRPAGTWLIGLMVIDSNGLSSSEDIKVHVNYRGVWKDFVIDRRIQDPIIMTWDFPVTYEDEGANRIRYLRVKLIYPAKDGDQPLGGIDTDNKLDLYMYNSTDDEIANTTAIGDDNRDAGDCDSEDRCVWMVIGGSTVKGFEPGDWSCDLQNDKTHNTDVKQLVVELQYR